MTRRLWLVLFFAGCSTSQDAGGLGVDCGQEAGTIARLDGGGLAEVPRGLDAGAGVDACPDIASPTEHAPAVDVGVDARTMTPEVAAEVSRDRAPTVDGGGIDSQPVDLGGDAEQCPNPNTVAVGGNCVRCGDFAGLCCAGNRCAEGVCIGSICAQGGSHD